MNEPQLMPLFLKLSGRRILLVGGGPVALEKAELLLRAGARVDVVAPESLPAFRQLGVSLAERAFVPADVHGAWFVVAAATPEVNRAVRQACDAEARFVVAVDDLASATAFGAARVERGGVTFAISTGGHAPALVRLLREALESVLPQELGGWLDLARLERARWKEAQVPFGERRHLLFRALEKVYGAREERVWEVP